MQADSAPPQPQADAAARVPVTKIVGPSRARSRARVARDLVQALAFAFAGIWAVYTFVYKEIIVPAGEPAAVVVTPTLEVIGRRGGTVLVRASFHLANRSRSRAYLPAVWFGVFGMRLEARDLADTAYARMNREAAAAEPLPTARFSQLVAADVIAAGRLLPDLETWYDPGDEQRVEQLLYVPADRFDVAQVYVEYLATKDISRLAAVRWAADQTGFVTPRLVFDGDTARVHELTEQSPAYLSWLRETGAGINFATATISLWTDAPTSSAPASPPPAAAPEPAGVIERLP